MRFLRSKFVKDTSGVAAVEFALLALPFFILVFALVETALAFMADVTLGRGVEVVGRQVRTGEIDTPILTKALFEEKVCDEVKIMLDCSKLKVDLSIYERFADIEIKPPMKDGRPDYSGFGLNGDLGPESVAALRVFCDWPIHVDVLRRALGNSDGTITLLGMTAFKTEAY